jgi:hypothetical protein
VHPGHAEPTAEELADSIRRRGLPEAVATMATCGGAEVHPALDVRAASIWSPAWSVIERSGRGDLVPLWSCDMTTTFSAGDGTFVRWSAEMDEPRETFPDFTATVRSLLTDLWEDDVADRDRRAIAKLLLPRPQVREALRPEKR